MAEACGRTRVPESVRIGGMSKAALLAALRGQGVRLNEAAERLFGDGRFTTLARESVVGIAARSVEELGFHDGATYGRLLARALELGLAECPLEVGPHLRIQAPDQPEGGPSTGGRAPPGSITVASPLLDGDEETVRGFYLLRTDGASWLRGYWSSPGHVWAPDDVLVFARDGAACSLP